MFNHFEDKYIFDNYSGCRYQNVERIHPLKQKEVGKMIDCLKEDDNVEYIVIFGSSADFSCNSYSDIDVYIKLVDKDRPLKQKPAISSEVDYIYNLDQDNALFREIERTGVLVYERKE
ncbi:MAG: nucleotidyltransferase domain-containing protein [Lachnospiraceae bacterium]|nr:nucleotidyltransferase domain-containing protein [Lachnospiraceae bacterium]